MYINRNELIDSLMTIGEAVLRLMDEVIKNGVHDEDYQCVCCPYCCDAEGHKTDD